MGSWSSKQTVPCLDLSRYQGKWIEIAKFYFEPEKNCNFSTVEYTLINDGNMKVIENCIREGSVISIKGTMSQINDKCPGRLFINFPMESNYILYNGKLVPKINKNFYTLYDKNVGNYWVLYTDYDNYAIVSTPDESCLWILSRKEMINISDFNKLRHILITRGYNLSCLMINPNLVTC